MIYEEGRTRAWFPIATGTGERNEISFFPLVRAAHVESPDLRRPCRVTQRLERHGGFNNPPTFEPSHRHVPHRIPVSVDLNPIGCLSVDPAAKRCDLEVHQASPVVERVEDERKAVVAGDATAVLPELVRGDVLRMAFPTAAADIHVLVVKKTPIARSSRSPVGPRHIGSRSTDPAVMFEGARPLIDLVCQPRPQLENAFQVQAPTPRLAALLVGRIYPIFSLLAPGQLGASPPSCHARLSPRAARGRMVPRVNQPEGEARMTTTRIAQTTNTEVRP